MKRQFKKKQGTLYVQEVKVSPMKEGHTLKQEDKLL